MDFALTDQQEAIRDAIAKICEGFPDAYWLKKDREGGFPHDFHQALADAGWLGICMPEEYGGAGLGITEAAIMMQAIAESGAGMSGASAVHMNIFGLNPVVVFGTEEQSKRMLPPMVEGQEKACFAVTEPNTGLNTTQLKTRAVAQERPLRRQRPEGLDLDRAGRAQDPAAGAHHAAGGGAQADPRPQPVLHGFRPQAASRCARSRRWAARPSIPTSCSSRISRSRWRTASARKGKGFEYILHGMNPERILIAAEAVGLGRVALARAAEYAKKRVVFDRPIGQNQAIQHPLAKNWMELEAARLMVMSGGLAIRQRACPAAPTRTPRNISPARPASRPASRR